MTLTDEGDIDMDEGHGNGQDCRWTLQCTSGSPTVTFNSFNTEANFDYVNVYDGETPDDPRVGCAGGLYASASRLHSFFSPLVSLRPTRRRFSRVSAP